MPDYSHAPEPSRRLTVAHPVRLQCSRTIVDASNRTIAQTIRDPSMTPQEADDNAHAIACLINGARMQATETVVRVERRCSWRAIAAISVISFALGALTNVI